jgi:hypothetical protein
MSTYLVCRVPAVVGHFLILHLLEYLCVLLQIRWKRLH